MNLSISDEITMKLVHYLITKENYQPIVVTGLENEIWLENTDKPFSVIRINNNYIHNNEQLEYDKFKAKAVIKEIKKKTLSINIDMLSILLDVGENVNLDKAEDKHITTCSISSIKELRNNKTINEIFPEMKEDKLEDQDPVEFFLNVTKDINESTTKKNRLYEKIFSKKLPIITYVLMAINILIFLLNTAGIIGNGLFYMSGEYFKQGQFWRVITYAFFHGDIIHLLCNMYSLYIIGPQVESKFGKVRFILIYLISAISGGLLSAGITNYVSVGASGAIFGVLGALLYFGMRFRLYLKESIKSQILPVIIINIGIGFMISGIDNACHIGGLIGGFLAAMALGIPDDERNNDHINGTIMLLIFLAFLCYLVFFR